MLVTKSSTQLPHTLNELKSSIVSCESITNKTVHKDSLWPKLSNPQGPSAAAGHLENISMQWNKFLITIPDHQVHWLYQQVILFFLVTNTGENDSRVGQTQVWRLSGITKPLAWDSPVLLDLIIIIWHPALLLPLKGLNLLHSELAASLRNSLASPRQMGQVRFDWKIQRKFKVGSSDPVWQLQEQKWVITRGNFKKCI